MFGTDAHLPFDVLGGEEPKEATVENQDDWEWEHYKSLSSCHSRRIIKEEEKDLRGPDPARDPCAAS